VFPIPSPAVDIVVASSNRCAVMCRGLYPPPTRQRPSPILQDKRQLARDVHAGDYGLQAARPRAAALARNLTDPGSAGHDRQTHSAKTQRARGVGAKWSGRHPVFPGMTARPRFVLLERVLHLLARVLQAGLCLVGLTFVFGVLVSGCPADRLLGLANLEASWLTDRHFEGGSRRAQSASACGGLGRHRLARGLLPRK
jgi:hypothetical protein